MPPKPYLGALLACETYKLAQRVGTSVLKFSHPPVVCQPMEGGSLKQGASSTCRVSPCDLECQLCSRKFYDCIMSCVSARDLFYPREKYWPLNRSLFKKRKFSWNMIHFTCYPCKYARKSNVLLAEILESLYGVDITRLERWIVWSLNNATSCVPWEYCAPCGQPRPVRRQFCTSGTF